MPPLQASNHLPHTKKLGTKSKMHNTFPKDMQDMTLQYQNLRVSHARRSRIQGTGNTYLLSSARLRGSFWLNPLVAGITRRSETQVRAAGSIHPPARLPRSGGGGTRRTRAPHGDRLSM
jgi:hypothetical protein